MRDIYGISQLNPSNKIPPDVLFNIIMVYEFGILVKHYPPFPPHNLICNRQRTCWTTWEDVISLRNRMNEIRPPEKRKFSNHWRILSE